MKPALQIFIFLLIVAVVSGCTTCGGKHADPPVQPVPCGCKPKCTDPNEEYIFTKYEDLTCNGTSPRLCYPEYACRCKRGFVRHEGKCIKECDCPSVCADPYEELIWTRRGQETCDGFEKDPCGPVQACRCIPGFVKHGGKCIRRSECPSKCQLENEEYVYTKYEDRTCDGGEARLCYPGYACRCKEGYVRKDGKCIRECDCPSKCGENEELVWAYYGEETCDGATPDPCTPVKECRCIPGYVRDNGKCIKKCDCPSKCKDPNEEYVWTYYEDENCDGERAALSCPVKACRCRKGYVRLDGKCIRKCDCPSKCSDPFEEYIFTRYEDATCDDPKKKVNCDPKYACRCIAGYVRHEGKCIRPCACPSKCGPDEVWIYTSYEDPTCDGEQAVRCEPIEACRCRRGLVRHEGKCIKPCDCPSKCKEFEEYVLAYYGEKTCNGRNPDPCEPVTECRCIKGYVRHEGKCIRECDCPPKCSGENEVWVRTTYEEPTCDDPNPSPCKFFEGCRCRNGYVRNNGKCIKLCDCPSKCSDPNEEYILTRYEDRTCDNMNPLPCELVKDCRCKGGFVRGKDGKCIKESECPCGVNEIWSERAPVEQETCTYVPIRRDYRPGCMCLPGFVRSDCDGKCIKRCEC